MKSIKYPLILLAGFCVPVMGQAADFSDPTWPCIQRKVVNLSLGIMWPHPVPEQEAQAKQRALGSTLALRKVSLEQAELLITEYVQNNPETSIDELGQIFRVTFDKIGSDRKAIITGIAKYAGKQTSLSLKIDEIRSEMSRLMAESEPDFDRVDALEEQLDWDERIYKDRARSLVYVCETPVLLEKRAYAIGQLLLQAVPD